MLTRVCPHQACCSVFLKTLSQFWQICCRQAHLIKTNTNPPHNPSPTRTHSFTHQCQPFVIYDDINQQCSLNSFVHFSLKMNEERTDLMFPTQTLITHNDLMTRFWMCLLILSNLIELLLCNYFFSLYSDDRVCTRMHCVKMSSFIRG